jgi:PAS domain S-box-containing protein
VHLSAEAKLLLQAQVLDAVEQAIMAVDLTGRIVFWNRYAETFSGWSAEEAQGRSIDEVFGTSLLMESVHANLAHLRQVATGADRLRAAVRAGRGNFSFSGAAASPSWRSSVFRSFKLSSNR